MQRQSAFLSGLTTGYGPPMQGNVLHNWTDIRYVHFHLPFHDIHKIKKKNHCCMHKVLQKHM